MVIRRLLAEPLGEAKRSRANESARCAWRSTSGARLKSLWSLLVGTGFSLCLAAPAFAQISGADFCESPFVAKVSAPISITAAAPATIRLSRPWPTRWCRSALSHSTSAAPIRPPNGIMERRSRPIAIRMAPR